MKKICPEFTDCYTHPPGYFEYCERCQEAVEWFKEHLYSYEERTMVGYLANRFHIDKEDVERIYENVWGIFGPDAEPIFEDTEAAA